MYTCVYMCVVLCTCVYVCRCIYMYMDEIHMLVCQSLSCVRLFVTPWTVACQAPLSVDSPGKNTGRGSHALLQGIVLIQELNQGPLR